MKAAKKKKMKYAVPMTVVKLVEKVQKHILEEPKRFDMGILVQKFANPQLSSYESMPPCGTVGCIAGWVSIIDLGKKLKWKKGSDYDSIFMAPKIDIDLMEHARKKLHLKEDWEGWGTDPKNPKGKNHKCTEKEMFDEMDWPASYQRRYSNERGGNGDKLVLAKIAVQRLDYFLRTGK